MLILSLLLALMAVACLVFVPDTVLILTLAVLMHGFALLSACHALLHKRDSRAALGWIAILLFMPPIGLPLYWLFGIARIDSQAVRLMEKAARKVIGGLVDLHGKSLREKPEGFIEHNGVPQAWHHLASPGASITGRCMIGGNALRVLHNGEAAYPVMLEAIREAKERVYLSSFIFGCDDVGKRFAAALREAAERGCDVRLLIDGVGSFHPWPRWEKRLGPRVRLAHFLPPSLIPPQFSINLRTHRKMLICDGARGFTGGMNISQHHLVELKRPNRVQDVHFRCDGPIAQQLEIAFLMDWAFATGDNTPVPMKHVEKQGSSLCRLLMDGPGTPEDTILDLVCAQISAAQHSVRIMSPYFLPPHRLHGELVSAVLRGVDVSVILPGENNHRLVDWAMRHQMPMLADRGVRVYRQPPPFAHTKLLLIDGEYTLLGSANLDPRSLNLNFELVMEALDRGLTEELTAFYDGVRSRSASVPPTYPALPARLRNAASWLFSPYL